MTENKDNNKFYTQFKEERAAQNIDLSEISTKTTINTRYLTAIEEGNFEILPIPYLRLFLRAYATEIGGDSDRSLDQLDSFIGEILFFLVSNIFNCIFIISNIQHLFKRTTKTIYSIRIISKKIS